MSKLRVGSGRGTPNYLRVGMRGLFQPHRGFQGHSGGSMRVPVAVLNLGELDKGYVPLAEVHPFDWACNPAIPEPMYEPTDSEREPVAA